ncbi:uncharacterized protein LOC130728508 isoform X2 [Lotus japonicus]|uniref:uncharacterized protein LOC130728508 isoform X2 n=1 Tax=Lotus japonicus TaxID=34305 RepID=UPI00258337D9|nr:uncharacterized protein LOC130728508 isoform X2 [Lotus japonicus]
MGSQKGFFHRKMEIFSGYFGVFLWVFTKVFMRFYSPEAMNSVCSSKFSHENQLIELNHSEPKTEDEAGFSDSSRDTLLESENSGAFSDALSHESNEIESNGCQPMAEAMKDCCSETAIDGSGNPGLEEEETSKLVFKFQYQSWNCNFNEELKGDYHESSDFVERDTVSASANKYEFFSGKSFSHFLEEPETANLTVEEFHVHSNDEFPLENQVTNDSEGKLMPENCEGVVDAENHDNVTESVHKEEVSLEKLKTVLSVEQQSLQPVTRNFLSEDDFICSSSDSDSVTSMDDGFLSDTDFGTTTEIDTLGNNEEENAGLTEEDLDFWDENLDIGYEPDDFAEEDEDIMEELGKIEEECRLEKSSGDSFQDSIKSKPENSVEPNSLNLTANDLEDSNRFDTLWEHQDLIEQLKMELKKVRATGLPTILEDSESPRIMEDLKPWKIDEKFQHGSTKNELPKFYKSYRERMRKFDILNYQKMYALGFLQSKDPLQSFSTHKSPSPPITSILPLPRGFHIYRRRKIEAAHDPTKKFMRELYCDLETVYVGHLCLSWEFLQWEYGKALELWESDGYGMRRFNEVAGEFQQFQVLLQRFMENELFQCPRVENYARNRCAMKNLLQVPVIREDNAKDKKKYREREADKDAITSGMLVEVLEESIRTIWRFIRADKDASSLKGAREKQVELQDPSDSELLVEIRTELEKKEKRLRELLRSGCCILKKFQKHHEDGTDQVLYFFSQVDMKLVWRVLNMSRITTDQLAWCRSKLNKINFVNRRIQVEPSFLLFPS